VVLPDVTVEDIVCRDSSTTHPYLDEDILSIKATNLGPGDVPDDIGGGLYIWIDGKLEWTYSWSTWSDQSFRTAGKTTTVEPQGLSDGTHVIKACMDPNNELSEVDESNNCLEKTIVCGNHTGENTTPGPQESENCVTPGRYYKVEAFNLLKVALGDVIIIPASSGQDDIHALSVTDCSNSGNLGVYVPWSGSSVANKAQIILPQYACSGSAPVAVSVTFSHGHSAKFVAYDKDNTQVDSKSAVGFAEQTLTLASATGISRIEIEGSEICITKICWECGEITPEPEPEPENCRTPGQFYKQEEQSLAKVAMAGVLIYPAVMSDGTVSQLAVTDCSNDKQLDVMIPWTEASASKKAEILFTSDISCQSTMPSGVEIYLTYGTNVKFEAFDDNGNLVDTVTGTSQHTPQIIALHSNTGIRRIEITGAEICITKICWECGEIAETPPVNNGNCDEKILREAYEAGYQAGLAAGDQSSSQSEAGNQCATFNFITNKLHIPCFNAGSLPTFWLDMKLINSDPVQLELTDVGENKE
jgi:hypothetical protein